jgi:hypothetical protein
VEEECFVMWKLDDNSWAQGCFAFEFTEPWQWQMSRDRILPGAYGGTYAPRNVHRSHLGCQKRQGGLISSHLLGRRGRSKRGMMGAASVRPGRARISKLMTPPAARSLSGRVANHTRWHVKKKILNPTCDLCQTSKTSAAV